MTSQPLSTISYNTELKLKSVLNKLYKEHIIQAYQYIKHKGEDGDKDHIHLRIEPNRRVDPMEIKEMFVENVPNFNKPLGCRPFRPSVEEDWFLYVVHDADYLRIKYGGSEAGEKIPYLWSDIVAPDDYDVEIAFIRAQAKMTHTSANIATQLRNGHEPIELVLMGENPHTVKTINSLIYENHYQVLSLKYEQLTKEFKEFSDLLKDAGLALDAQNHRLNVDFKAFMKYYKYINEEDN